MVYESRHLKVLFVGIVPQGNVEILHLPKFESLVVGVAWRRCTLLIERDFGI